MPNRQQPRLPQLRKCACAEAQQTAALSRLLLLIRNVLGEYPDGGAFDRGTGVEQVGRDLLDRVSVGQELRLPGGTQGAPHAGKFVHRGVTDLTFNRFAVVNHRKPKRQSFEVVSQYFASRQRHRNSLALRLTVLLHDSFVEKVACMIRNSALRATASAA
jgi:hypothetical protein